jgi:hypothetical protein
MLTPIPRGATGFWHVTDAVFPTPIDPKQFHGACHQAAREAGWKVESVTKSVQAQNFHRAVLTTTRPDLAAAFAHTPFRMLGPAELNDPLTDAHLADLPRAELGQIRYWKPETVGQTIFNFWD